MKKGHTVFITGASGYVGAMLVAHFNALDDVERIIALDKDPMPELLENCEKVMFLQMNTADAWQEQVATYMPSIVIHCAWHIREIYGNRELSWKWNIDGSDAVFDFCFEHEFVKQLIHFSSVASYGASSINTPDQFFTEQDPLRESESLYAEEKRISENHLTQKYELYQQTNPELAIAVLRPASITGPRGRFMREGITLQSALSGEQRKTFPQKIVSLMTTWVPVTSGWLRQFIHEDDVVSIVQKVALEREGKISTFETYITCPPDSVVTGTDIAALVGKKAIVLPPVFVRIAFFLAWHLTRGRIPTAPGSWKGYSYPIPVDGSHITRDLAYTYQYRGVDALTYTDGMYEYAVPPLERKNKTRHE